MKKRSINGGCIDFEDIQRVITNILFVFLSIAVVATVGYILYRFHRYFLEGPYRVDIDKARKTKYDVYLDVRTQVERELLGEYPGSIHIPSLELEDRLEKEIPNKKTKILAYCNTGHRAKLAAEKLRKMGYENAVYIAESYRELM
jgi:rhodanese-related sulfurtransferase